MVVKMVVNVNLVSKEFFAYLKGNNAFINIFLLILLSNLDDKYFRSNTFVNITDRNIAENNSASQLQHEFKI